MNLKRGILIGLALYIAEIIIMLVAIYIIFRLFAESKSISSIYALTTFIITVILTSLASLWYFNKVKRNVKEGFKLGLIFVAVSIILQLAVSLIMEESFENIINAYKSIYFYISFIIIIATSTFIGSRNHNKEITPQMKKKKKRA
ncbi:MAG: hypothetical protein AABX96_02350 [Nanoarchaeota archaeon]